jgi:hypothetical protein
MKIIAYDRFKAGVTLDTVRPFLKEEVSNVWRLWKDVGEPFDRTLSA